MTSKLLLPFLLCSVPVCLAQTTPAPRTKTPLSKSAASKPSALDMSLFGAVQTGDVARVQSLLRRGADADAHIQVERNFTGKSVLARAFSYYLQLCQSIGDEERKARQREIVRLLVAAGANLNAPDGFVDRSVLEAAEDAAELQWLLALPAEIKPDPDIALVAATRIGSLELAKRLLRQGADPSAATWETALGYAAQNGDLKSLDLLLEAGARVDERGRSGSSALMAAAQQGDRNRDAIAGVAAARLLRAGARIEQRDEAGKTPLVLAVGHGNLEVARALLEAGAEVNARDKTGVTALMLIVTRAPMEKPFVPLLLKHGADVDARNAAGETVSMQALAFDNSYLRDGETVAALIKAGTDLSARDAQNRDIVERAGSTLSLRATQILLESGLISPSQRAALLKVRPTVTLLDVLRNGPSAGQDAMAVARIALQNGADVNARDAFGDVPLDLTGDESRVRLLLASGANAKLARPWALSSDMSLPVVGLLLDAGFDPNVRDKNGQTFLHRLCEEASASLPLLQLLFAAGADADARDSEGQTPLMLAAGRNEWDGKGFEFLLDALRDGGAEIEATDDKGETALMKAANRAQTGNAEALLRRGASVNARDKAGQSALLKACQTLDTSNRNSRFAPVYWVPAPATVELLIENGADVNARDKAGQSALICIARAEPPPDVFTPMMARTETLPATKIEIAELLIANGADVSAKTANGNTALKWAVARGNMKLTALLQAKGK